MIKEIEVNGQRFKIKTPTLGDKKDLAPMTNGFEYQANLIYRCVVEPKFKDISEVYNLDGEIADQLYIEISEISQPSPDFLQRLSNFLEATRRASKIMGQSPGLVTR
jgi:hypothetical protein